MQQDHRLSDYLRILRRGKWIILQAAILVPAAAVIYSLQQQSRYRASADVLINSQNAVQSIAGTSQAPDDPQRFLDTQAALAREPAVARSVVANIRGITADQLIKNSSVREKTGANLLVFSVTDHRPPVATRLAAEYAKQYVAFERKLDTGALQVAIKNVRDRIASLGPNAAQSPLYATLIDKEQQLVTALTLQTSTASVVRVPDHATKVEPRPVRNGILGFVLGVIVGLALALLRNALDSRVRTADEIASQTGLTLLARLPAPARKQREHHRLSMLADPFEPYSEAVRTLRTNVEFSNLQTRAKTIMVTSAVEQEGKSTTAGNLALAFARAGDRVVLVDLDLRRPFVHYFFDHESRPGITDVALGQVELADALFEVPVAGGPAEESARFRRRNGFRGSAHAARLQPLGVLPAGQLPPDPGEFVGSEALAQTLGEIAEQADIVIVDSPPLLHVSDALTLSKTVDAILVVASIDLLRRNTLAELNRVLQTSPAPRLGFVLTGAEHEEGFDYSYYSGYYSRSHEAAAAAAPERKPSPSESRPSS